MKLEVRLFYNMSLRKHFIQIGDCLFPVRHNIIEAVHQKEGIEVINVADTKEMQLKCKP